MRETAESRQIQQTSNVQQEAGSYLRGILFFSRPAVPYTLPQKRHDGLQKKATEVASLPYSPPPQGFSCASVANCSGERDAGPGL